MLEVNLKEIRNIIDDYNKILESVEVNDGDVFHNFNELNEHWNDDDHTRLNESVYSENKSSIRFAEDLKRQIGVYKLIENKYKSIGKKVKCDLDSKYLISNKIDNIISKLESVINDYDSLGSTSFYPRAYMIYNEKQALKDSLKQFRSIKSRINKKYSQINDIENEISLSLNFDIEKKIANNYEIEG